MHERVGSFKILDRLGEGGMGIVYAAQDERLGRRVAIKMIRSEAASGDSRVRFWREARSAARISHPNVCQVYDIGEENGTLWIAMELLEGDPLVNRLVQGTIPLDQAGSIVLGVLAALEALHRHEIVHRDLKPSNVFLTGHGVKLLDFGLARPFDDTTRGLSNQDITATGLIVGTPRYMAPEQWKRDPIDARTDLFAVGALLYEMLSGNPAFPGHGPAEIRHAALFENPPALSGPPAVIAMDRLIQRALAKKPEDRFASAPEMAAEIRSALRLLEGGEIPRARAVTRVMVLPFRCLRADEECEFLTFSLPDAITASLAGIDSIVVRSTLAASRFTGPNLDLKEIAEIAEVDLVVTGTLLRVGDQVRVSTQLLEAPYGTVLWTQSSQIGMIDLFQLQDSLARQIVESISQPLAGRERRSLQRDVPATAKAYEFYLRANQLAQSNQGWELARDLYLQCLEEDAKYAPAWAQLGRIYRVLAKYVEIDSEENRLRAADAFHRALELNPDLSLAHNLYVYLEVEMGRAKDAMVRLLDRAKSRPSEASLLAGLVQACRYCGLLDASVAAAERARRLDPNLPLSVTYTHWMMGNYEGAMETRDYDLPFIRAYSLSALGRHEEARAIFHEIQRVPHLHARGFGTAMFCILEGDHAGALEYMRSIENSSFRDPEGLYFIARCYAYLGHTESALRLLDRVVTGGYYCDQTMARDPWMDSVRTHPDFVAALRRSEALRRDAVAAYLEHEGDRILGVRPLV